MDHAPAPGASIPDVAEPGIEVHPSRAGSAAPRPGRAGVRPWLSRHRPSRSALVLAGLLAVLTVPLVVAVVVLRHTHWYPTLDLAWTEMRLRDVASSHPPLLGLAGRLGPYGHQGSHPGPLSFWALWPFYEIFGASSWAMEAASAAVHVVAMGVLLWIANRRGGLRLALGVAVVLTVLTAAYGAETLTQAWNPYLPLLWWLVFLFAMWSVLCDDLLFLPVAVVAGSLCAQTHVPYVGMTVAVGAIAFGIVVVETYRRRRREALRRLGAWSLIAVALGVVVWIPPLVEQFTTSPGNLSVLFDYFRHPPEPPVGLGEGLRVVLVHLNPWALLSRDLVPSQSGQTDAATGSVVPGLVFLAGWLASAVAARRLRLRSLVRLQLLLGIALVLAVVSISRIFGLLWYYLSLWAWGITALMMLAMGWTIAELVARRAAATVRDRDALARRLRVLGIGTLCTLLLVSTVRFAIRSADTEVLAPRLSRTLGELVPPTARALERRDPTNARRGRYFVTFVDPVSIGAQGFGLMNELERRGFTVGTFEGFRSAVTPHRVMHAGESTAVVHMAVGPSDIAAWRAKPNVEEVAAVDPRGAAQRAEYRRLQDEAVHGLRSAGLVELVPEVQKGDLFASSLNPRVPKAVREQLARMSDLGLPTAVFVGPPSSGE